MENIKDKMDKVLRNIIDTYLYNTHVQKEIAKHPWFGELNSIGYFEKL